ncbi:MAG: hypothetical protein ABI064_04405 [Acidobacteriaceae bacterium]
MYSVIFLGIATGCRSMTPMAVLCWAMWLAKLPVTRLNFWEANVFAVVIFSLAAIGEYYGDTRPEIPSRTSWGPLLARLVLGTWIGVSVFSSFMEPLMGGALFGIAGVLIGAFGGKKLRLWLARVVGRDLPVALAESALTLAISLWAMHGIVADWVRQSAIQ